MPARSRKLVHGRSGWGARACIAVWKCSVGHGGACRGAPGVLPRPAVGLGMEGYKRGWGGGEGMAAGRRVPEEVVIPGCLEGET